MRAMVDRPCRRDALIERSLGPPQQPDRHKGQHYDPKYGPREEFGVLGFACDKFCNKRNRDGKKAKHGQPGDGNPAREMPDNKGPGDGRHQE